MKILLLFIITLFSIFGSENYESYKEEIKAFQDDLNKSYASKNDSPLSKKQRKLFKKNKGHNFFPINETYKVLAKFQVFDEVESIKMATSNDRIANYDIYGKASFSLDGQNYVLNIYQSHRLRSMEGFEDHLFLPFTDLSSGYESYGGGRYIDVSIPEGNQIEIDFNKAYAPYCAYSSNYSCPIPPKENFLNVKIEAGVKKIKLK